MKNALFVTMLGLLLAAGSALGQDVRYNFDKNTDFSKFKTYKWVAVKDAGKVDDLLDKQIKAIVTSQLVAKGLTQVDDDSANLFLAYQVGIRAGKAVLDRLQFGLGLWRGLVSRWLVRWRARV